MRCLVSALRSAGSTLLGPCADWLLHAGLGGHATYTILAAYLPPVLIQAKSLETDLIPIAQNLIPDCPHLVV